MPKAVIARPVRGEAPLMALEALTALLAHQGGWDEALMVLTPIAIFGLLLRFANRRASRLGDGETLPEPPAAHPKGRISED